jgi:murein DD-endopeptidase MepM/ murein hydrolase activator NlpD
VDTDAVPGPDRRLLRPLILALGAVLLAPVLLAPVPAAARPSDDPRWVFFTKDTTTYRSPWFAGAHRKLVKFGCNHAPYYAPDPRCRGGQGFHHGLDIAIDCGTSLRAGRAGWVVDHASLGPAYGVNPVLIRNHRLGIDIVIGHTRVVDLAPGDRLVPGRRFALVGDSGAPDGCHLHFEVRALGGGLATARNPLPYLDLVAAG